LQAGVIEYIADIVDRQQMVDDAAGAENPSPTT
jgi:hypothetical protein